MPKILVADDNSNVQRTVALALSGLGIEVVAVNNGEAAVRKLSDFTPDLILADIFMPVRNGYEVCEYVKHSSQLAQTPVVLLIGAFDPFDEREAQRVGADGILKKPFVPPDPLIAMVKTLLDRVLASRPVPATVSAGPAMSPQRTAAPSAREVYPSAEELPEHEPEADYGARERVALGEGEHPAAFGDLFESPVEQAAVSAEDATAVKDDSLILTSKRDAALGDPAFWRKEDNDREPAFEASFTSSAATQEVEHPWEAELQKKPELVSAPAPVEEESAPPDASFKLIHEVPDETLTTVNPASILQDFAAESTLSVDSNRSPDLATSPLDWMTSAPPSAVEQVNVAVRREAEAVVPVDMDEGVQAESLTAKPSASPVASLESESAADSTVASIQPVVPPVAVSAVDLGAKEAEADAEVHAAAVQPVEVPAAQTVVQASVMQPVVQAVIEPVVQPVVQPVAQPAVQPVAVAETLRDAHVDVPATKSNSAESAHPEQWADLTETIEEEVGPAFRIPTAVADKNPAAQADTAHVAEPVVVSKAPSPAVPTEPINYPQLSSQVAPQVASPDPAVVEAVVQRVLEKMSPQVIDIITREFLRPVVQALVKREVEKR